MKIFISHSTTFDYQEELYKPLRESELNTKHELIFPHESDTEISTKDSIRDCDLFVAEVTYPSTGSGIEIGWANGNYVTIACFYKKGEEISKSLKFVTDTIFEYESIETMIAKIIELADAL